MGALGSVINDVVDSSTGRSSGTNLHDFLSRFSSSDGKMVNQINPLTTFEVSFKFEPSAGTASDKGILATLGTAITGLATNAMNNMTGGLANSLMNDIFGKSVKEQHDSFNKVGQHTFMEYLLKANMLVGGENWFNSKQGLSPIELQLGFFVQSITVPKITIYGEQKTNTLLGSFPVNGLFVQTDNNNLQLEILNTKLPLIERIFYPWMKEVTLPYWSYETQPYTTATITIDFSKHMDIQYVFYGCKPTNLDMIQPSQEANSSVTRQATFMFDCMFITSKKIPVMESTLNKLLDTGKTLFNSAANMMNI